MAPRTGRGENMEQARVVRTVEALIFLALDQRGNPEGRTAKDRAREWIAKHGVQSYWVSSKAVQAAKLLNLGFAPLFRADPPPPPPNPGNTYNPGAWEASPPVKVRYKTQAPFVDVGTCEWCGQEFERGKDHQGMKARYCTPQCHHEKRNHDAKVRMERNRDKKRAVRNNA